MNTTHTPRIIIATGSKQELQDALNGTPPAQPINKSVFPVLVAPAPVKKHKKGKKLGPAAKDGKPGVIASIIEYLQAATEQAPVSKDAMLQMLSQRFPERDPDGMKKTIHIQTSGRLQSERGLDIVKTDKGMYIRSK